MSRTESTGAVPSLAERVASLKTTAKPSSIQFEPPVGREVLAWDPVSGWRGQVLMFASNNYLGLWAHPHVSEAVQSAISRFGTGGGGSPQVTGRYTPQRRLEEKFSELRKAEATMLFNSAYAANLGLASALVGGPDVALVDADIHTSFMDGLLLGRGTTLKLAHNQAADLEEKLRLAKTRSGGSVVVAVSGLYGLDATLAPLNRIAPACTRAGAYLVLDDVHSMGTLGEHGRGAAEHFGVEEQVALTVTSFSTLFGVAGAAVSGPADLIEYLRLRAHSFTNSTAPSPLVAETVLAGLEVMEREPERLRQLKQHAAALKAGLAAQGIAATVAGGIGIIRVPPGMDVDWAREFLLRAGLYVHYLPHPAVPRHEERFRVSLSAMHRPEDIQRLIACMAQVWRTAAPASAPH
ncbi:MAG: aminotransferase class I/II-fold pyridoxal phosphate-dependent enzyme [Hyalangium sp.]|uniref:aminotransferase class I/II-fold pyridoxal phosphate-dependent enzyme n=1 Tax=Hyalangium sp. TaxID=2028555 RepID=UPI00389B3462